MAAGIWRAVLATALVTGFLESGALPAATQLALPAGSAAHPAFESDYAAVPTLRFEPNRGQGGDGVAFLARGPDYGLSLNATDAVLTFNPPAPRGPEGADRRPALERAALSMHLLDSAPAAGSTGEEPLPSSVSYFFGPSETHWQTNVPTFAKVRFTDVYPGIDMAYYGQQGRLEFDFLVAAGADPAAIRFAFPDAVSVRPQPEGGLTVAASSAQVEIPKPFVYQDQADGRIEIDAAYRLDTTGAVSVELSAYDSSRPLVIDPVLAYSTYFGGAGLDSANRIAVDAAGNAYITGYSMSPTLPGPGGTPVTGGRGNGDVFVTKLNASGSNPVYTAYFGGSQFDEGLAIAVDQSGSAYVAGETASADFPVTPGAFDVLFNGGTADIFITKLSPDGSSLVYSTFLGGSGDEHAHALALDAAGNAYITGHTSSPNFPTTPGAYQRIPRGNEDIFVAKLNATGSALTYSTLVTGANHQHGHAIAVDAAGNAYVGGHTNSPDFPTTSTGFSRRFGGVEDGVVFKLDPTGSTLMYSTFLGGGDYDEVNGLAIDATGAAYVVGATASTDFPTTLGAFDRTSNGNGDTFVAKLNPSGSGLLYSTYFGGNGNDQGKALALDADGGVYIAGYTTSSNLPAVNAIQPVYGAAQDGFLAKVNSTGTALNFSTYLGGAGYDEIDDVAVDPSGNAYVVGITIPPSMPTTPGAFSRTGSGGFDAFVARIGATYVPGSVGGRGFGLGTTRSGAATLSWLGGIRQTGYSAVRLDAATGSISLLPAGGLPASATSYADTTPPANPACYLLLAIDGQIALGQSDMLCRLPGSGSAPLAPGGFTLRLNQSTSASLAWAAPGSQDAYALFAIPATGAMRTIVLPGGATSATDATGGMTTCYVLLALAGGNTLGTTDVLCGIPGAATILGPATSLPVALNAARPGAPGSTIAPSRGGALAAMRERVAELLHGDLERKVRAKLEQIRRNPTLDEKVTESP